LRSFERQVVAQLEALPQVDSASLTSRVPMGDREQIVPVTIDNRPAGTPAEMPATAIVAAGLDFFSTLRVPVDEGRAFTPADAGGGPPAVVVSREAARRFWPGQSAVGRTLTVRAEGWPATPLRVVGVVRDVRPADADGRVGPQVYVPWSWHPERRMRFVVRTTADDPLQLVPAIRARVAMIEPDEPIFDAFSMKQILYQDVASEYVLSIVFTAIALIALAVAAVGVYGLVAHNVTQRTREIGLRLALGAAPAAVIRMVLSDGTRPVLYGVSSASQWPSPSPSRPPPRSWGTRAIRSSTCGGLDGLVRRARGQLHAGATREPHRSGRSVTRLTRRVNERSHARHALAGHPSRRPVDAPLSRFTAAAVLTLALGIGASSAVSSLADATAWRPPDVPRPSQIVRVLASSKDAPYAELSYPDYAELRSNARTMSGLIAYEHMTFAVARRATESARYVGGWAVSDNFFTALDIEPALGRGFTADDAHAARAVAVISDRLWTVLFDRDPAIVGRSTTISGTPFTIVGVASPRFGSLELYFHPDLFIPLQAIRTAQPRYHPTSSNSETADG
jgi:hypothetical protein